MRVRTYISLQQTFYFSFHLYIRARNTLYYIYQCCIASVLGYIDRSRVKNGTNNNPFLTQQKWNLITSLFFVVLSLRRVEVRDMLCNIYHCFIPWRLEDISLQHHFFFVLFSRCRQVEVRDMLCDISQCYSAEEGSINWVTTAIRFLLLSRR